VAQETRKGRDETLLDTSLALEPPDILHDLIDIIRRNTFDFRHVAEFPMMRLDAVGGGPLKCRIAMMIRLVDFMHQGRAVVGSRRLLPVTSGTVRVEFGFA